MGPATSSEPRALVERAVDALGRGDVETLASYLDDDVTWEAVGQDFFPGGPRFVGKESCLRDLAPAAAAVFDMSTFDLHVRGIVADGSTVVVEFVLSATTTRGRRYENTYCMVFTVAQGRIRTVREYTDTRYSKRVLFD